MPTEYQRVNIVVEPALYGMMQSLAAENGMSLSSLAEDLIKKALELREDVTLVDFAEERERTYSRKTALTHEQAWK
jgi:hypothetical protein